MAAAYENYARTGPSWFTDGTIRIRMAQAGMKIIHINAVNGIGSTGRTVSDLAHGLAYCGVVSRVAYSTGPPTTNGYKIGSSIEKKLHALGSRVFGTQAYFSSRGTRDLLQYIGTESPDIVHLHNLHSNYVHLPMLLQHLAHNDIATVLTLDDCWFYTGKCCHYTVDACDRWRTGCGSCPRLRKDNPSWWVDATAKMWNNKKRDLGAIPRLAVIGVSDWITSEARASILSNAAIITRIYNWIDTDVFRPAVPTGARAGLRDSEFTILGVASAWSDAKGLNDFIRLANVIDAGALDGGTTGVPTRPRVILVGAVKHTTPLPQSITVIQPTNDVRALAKLYAGADLFLQLSREESFGKVTAEALASGTPSIAYDSTANPELIGDNCGYVVDSSDFDQLIHRIRQVKANTRAAYSESCRRFALDNFSKVELIQDHLELYRQILKVNL